MYVTLGTVFNRSELLRLLLEGLDGMVSALVTTGRNVDPQSLGSLGPNVRVERFVPQAHVLPHCAAVVAHAGAGSVLGALAHGLPLVLVPQGADRFDNAARCAAAGAAVVLRPESSLRMWYAWRSGASSTTPSFVGAARSVQARSRRCRPRRRSRRGSKRTSPLANLAAVSPRARTALLVAAFAALAAVVVAGAAVWSAEQVESTAPAGAKPKPRQGFPPLELAFGVRDDAEAAELRRAAALYEAGKRQQAAAIFARYDSLEAKLGAAFAAWPASEDRIEQLGALYPRSSLVQLHLGLSRFWAGLGSALTAWREARDVEPDTPYAVRAGDFLYLDQFAPGLPGFIVSFDYRVAGETPAEQLQLLAADRTLRGRLLYGIALQGLGRPVSARRAFAEALARAPNDVDALVADAVGRYDKGNPSAAFSRLGPLTRRFPSAATVRFHLGLLLLWQKDVQEATRQLELARKVEPGSKIAGEATRFLDAIRNAGTS